MKFLKGIHPSNWTKLARTDRSESDDLRRDILFSQVLIFGLFVAILHFCNDFIQGNVIAYSIDILFIIVLIIFYHLNERGAHRIAKFMDLSVLNIFIFILAATMDEHVKMSFNFFPMAILAFLVFYKTELLLSIIFSSISLLLLIILELTNYQPFGDLTIKEGTDAATTYINVIGSFLLSVMGLTLLVKLNQKAENELKSKEAHLSKANKELDRFVYSTSHDLRAPLLSVKGLTNLMKYRTDDEELLDYIKKVDGRIEDLDQFIREIMDYSRNARVELKHVSIDLNEMVDYIYEKLRYVEDADKIEMKKKLDLEKINSDPSRLNVILSNIISNAIKYKDEEKAKNWIEIAAYKNKHYNIIKITDNGIGIQSGHQTNIFKMFYRANDQSKGSGLGLYIVKEMIDKLNGEISLESLPGKGTSFVLKIPE